MNLLGAFGFDGQEFPTWLFRTDGAKRPKWDILGPNLRLFVDFSRKTLRFQGTFFDKIEPRNTINFTGKMAKRTNRPKFTHVQGTRGTIPTAIIMYEIPGRTAITKKVTVRVFARRGEIGN